MGWKLKAVVRQESKMKANKSLQRHALKGLAGFGSLMVLLTILSRAAANMTVPEVEIGVAGRGTLDYQIHASGRVEENQVQAVSAVPGIRVSRICVNQGDYVKAGDPLFQVDLKDLKKQILLKKREIEKADLGIQDIEERKKQEEQERTKEQQRAQEDYERAARTGDKAVQRAYNAMAEAQNRLQDYQQQKLTASKQYEAQRGAEPGQEDGQQQQALEDAFVQAQNSYEDAVELREKSLSDAVRLVEDSKKPVSPDSSDKISKIDRKLLKSEQKRMKALYEKKGIVSSEIEGVVRDIKIESGDDTLEGKNMDLADISSGCRFTALIPKEQQKFAAKGEEAVLSPDTEGQKITELMIDSVRESSDQPEMLEVTVLIPDNRLEMGSTANLEIRKETEEYAYTVPIEALRSEDGGYFVLVPGETETVLGSELTAAKIEVQVLEKNDRTAALEGAGLSVDQPVIISSSKPVKAGDRICLRED